MSEVSQSLQTPLPDIPIMLGSLGMLQIFILSWLMLKPRECPQASRGQRFLCLFQLQLKPWGLKTQAPCDSWMVKWMDYRHVNELPIFLYITLVLVLYSFKHVVSKLYNSWKTKYQVTLEFEIWITMNICGGGERKNNIFA